MNAKIAKKLNPPLRIGIGVHSGDAIVRYMGSPESPIRSAVGDKTNVAARLDAMTKQFDAGSVETGRRPRRISERTLLAS